jgi:putative ABC transport system permease protein
MRTGKARVAFAMGGVAVATLLLAFILALYRGWNDGLVTYVDETETDIWLTPFGAESFFTPGIFQQVFLDLAAEVDGVVAVTPLVYQPLKLRFEGEAFDTWVVGFPNGAPGGPPGIKTGSRTPGPGEIVLDSVLSKLSGARIGDEVDVGGQVLKVVGISRGGNAVFAQLAFVDIEVARGYFRRLAADSGLGEAPFDINKTINLGLVKTQPERVDEVYARLKSSVPGVKAWLPAEFSDNSSAALRQSMLPILLIILALAFLVGTMVLGLTVYTSVLEKEREFGVIKALGVPGPGLLRVVLEQALVTCVAGFVLGMGGALVAAWLVTEAVPQFITNFRWADAGLALAGAVAMSVIASIVPAGRIMRADPLAVFKA